MPPILHRDEPFTFAATNFRTILDAKKNGDWGAVHEAAISRIWRQVQDAGEGKKSFAFVSAYRQAPHDSTKKQRDDQNALNNQIP